MIFDDLDFCQCQVKSLKTFMDAFANKAYDKVVGITIALKTQQLNCYREPYCLLLQKNQRRRIASGLYF